MVTEKDTLHKSYLDICDEMEVIGLEKYNMRQLLYNEVYWAQSISWKEVFYLFVKTIFFDMKKYLWICQDRRNDDVVLVWRKWNRRDHDGYWEKICNACEEYTRISFEEESLNLRNMWHFLSIKNAIRNYRQFCSIYKSFVNIKNIRHKVFLAMRLVKVKAVDEMLQVLEIKPKVVMCAFDSSFYENVAMQYYKNKGVVTVANQHGQPVFKSHDYDRMNQSQILNFKCDYFLAKGEFTKKQFVEAGKDGECVVVIGSFYREMNIKEYCHKGKMFCVFLNCITLPNAKERNAELLEISRELSRRLDCRFYIKVHPSDSISNYNDVIDEHVVEIIGKEKTISELSSDIGFGIFNESSVFLDLLDNKIKPYYWDSGVFFPLVEDDNSTFGNVDEIERKVRTWFNYTEDQKVEYFDKISDYYNAAEDVENNIREFIGSLL